VALRLLDYPAWRVEVNGKPIAPQHPEGTAQMLVPLQPGTSQVRVDLVMTRDREAGAAITVASLLVTVLLFLSVGRQRLKGRDVLA
jgi:hypothetical protein